MSDTLTDLTPFQLLRPEKVLWTYPATISNPIDQFRSKSLRKFLARVEEYLAQANITSEVVALDEAGFREWLTYYTAKMKENGFSLMADMDWYHRRVAEGYQIQGLWFWQAGKLVASGILRVKGTEEIVFAFKASDKLELAGGSNSSIGSVVDYYFQKLALGQGFQRISAGRSRNTFGVINSLGYLDFKLRLGYDPSPDPTSPLLTNVPVDEQGRALFLATPVAEPHRFSWYELNPTEQPWTENRIPSLSEPIHKVQPLQL